MSEEIKFNPQNTTPNEENNSSIPSDIITDPEGAPETPENYNITLEDDPLPQKENLVFAPKSLTDFFANKQEDERLYDNWINDLNPSEKTLFAETLENKDAAEKLIIEINHRTETAKKLHPNKPEKDLQTSAANEVVDQHLIKVLGNKYKNQSDKTKKCLVDLYMYSLFDNSNVIIEKNVYGNQSDKTKTNNVEPIVESVADTKPLPENIPQQQTEKHVYGIGSENRIKQNKNVFGNDQSENRTGELHDKAKNDEEFAYADTQRFFGDLLPRYNVPKSSTAEDFFIDVFVEIFDYFNSIVTVLRANAYKERIEALRARASGIREYLSKGIKKQLSSLEAGNTDEFIKVGADMLARMDSFSNEEKETFKKGMRNIANNLQELDTLNRKDPRYASLQNANNEWMKYLEQRLAGKSVISVSARSTKQSKDFMQSLFTRNNKQNA